MASSKERVFGYLKMLTSLLSDRQDGQEEAKDQDKVDAVVDDDQVSEVGSSISEFSQGTSCSSLFSRTEKYYIGRIKTIMPGKEIGFITIDKQVAEKLQVEKDILFPLSGFQGEREHLRNGAVVKFKVHKQKDGRWRAHFVAPADFLEEAKDQDKADEVVDDDQMSEVGSSISEFSQGTSCSSLFSRTEKYFTGRIKMIIPGKQFGFIVVDKEVAEKLQVEKDILFPLSGFQGEREHLRGGAVVKFKVRKQKDGRWKAYFVTPADNQGSREQSGTTDYVLSSTLSSNVLPATKVDHKTDVVVVPMATVSEHTGTLASILPEKKLGFITVDASCAKDLHLNKDLFFSYHSVLCGMPEIGKRVKFKVRKQRDGRLAAYDVYMAGDKYNQAVNGEGGKSLNKYIPELLQHPEIKEEAKTGKELVRPKGVSVSSLQDSSEKEGQQSARKNWKPDRENSYLRQGLVHTVKEDFGFISPLDVKNKDSKNNIYFKKDKMPTFCPELKVGDLVEYIVGGREAGRLFCSTLKVKKYSIRPNTVIQNYVDTLWDQVQKELVKVSDLVRYPEIFAYMTSQDDFNGRDVETCLRLLCHVMKNSSAAHSLVKECMTRVCASKLFTRKSGTVKARLKDGTLSTDCLISFLCHLVKLSTSFFPYIIDILEMLAKLETHGNIEWLFDIMRCVAAGFKSDQAVVSSWKNLPLVPCEQEMKTSVTNMLSVLSAVPDDGTFSTGEEYLDTYFQLYRAECFIPICKGVNSFLKGDLDHRDMNVFTNVNPRGFAFSKSDGFVFTLEFQYRNKKDSGFGSQVLKYGNLLCISLDGLFKEKIWATVHSHEKEIKNGVGVVSVVVLDEVQETDPSKLILSLLLSKRKGVMVESPNYYTASKPVLKALRKMEETDIPLPGKIINCDTKNPQAPNWTPYDFNPESYIANEYPTLDVSQREAMEHCLTSKLAIVQGPPGTGKTFLGVQVVDTILKLGISDPILVLTYKNHALDEFVVKTLELSSVDKNDVCRLGGRSLEEKLAGLNIKSLLQSTQESKELVNNIRNIKEEMRVIEAELTELVTTLDLATFLTIPKLLERLTSKQKQVILQELLTSRRLKLKGESSRLVQKYLTCKDADAINLEEGMLPIFQKIIRYWLPSKEELLSFSRYYRLSFEEIHVFSNDSKEASNNNNEDSNYGSNSEDKEEEEVERLASSGRRTLKIENEITLKSINTRPEDIIISLLDLVECPYPASSWQNLASLSQYDKVFFLNLLMSEEYRQYCEQFTTTFHHYSELSKCLRELQNQRKADILKTKKIIALTVTGACLFRDLISLIRPSVVIIEEAAEILEPQLMGCLGSWVDHLVLIGDHQQLRPQVDTFELVKQFKFDISMMERLIKSGVQYKELHTQNRMRPEISMYLRDIYPGLKDNLSLVAKHKIPPVLGKSMFFWSHCEKETVERSITNIGEVNYVKALLLLFLRTGYKPNNITILSAYLGQKRLLRQMLSAAQKEYSHLFGLPSIDDGAVWDKADLVRANVPIQTIDMYQGDENDIVIVSLVRSNDRGKVGFLNALNRRCVAQSRGRCGVYFVGNHATVGLSETWRAMLEKLTASGLLDSMLTVYCPDHADNQCFATSPDETVSFVKKWFCKAKCGVAMPCGHTCPCLCHHGIAHPRCKEIITFVPKSCVHQATRVCSMKEEDFICRILTSASLPCGHNCQKLCHQSLYSIECKENVTVTFSSCGHQKVVPCKKKASYKECMEKCTKYLQCGHMCSELCSVNCNLVNCKVCLEQKRLEIEAQKKRDEKIRQLEFQKAKEQLNTIQLSMDNAKPLVIEDLQQEEEEYLSVEDQVKKYIQPGHNWAPIITQIQRVKNGMLLERWYKAHFDMFRPDYKDKKFHVTDDTGINGIIKEGFRLPSSGGMYGRGVYFATDSSKSAQEIYTKGSSKLLLCDVLIGKTHQVSSASPNMDGQRLRELGCDSLFVPRQTGGSADEQYDKYVIFNPDQAYPKYIIHWKKASLLLNSSMPFLGSHQPAAAATTSMKLSRRTKNTTIYSIAKQRFLSEDGSEIHFRMAESHFYRLADRGSGYGCQSLITQYQIDRVEYRVNQTLIDNFSRKKVELESKYRSNPEFSKIIFVFHGTQSSNIDAIFDENFRMDKIQRTVHGHGIYFSEFPDVSLGYSNGDCALVLCKLLMGKHPSRDTTNYNQLGFDSNIVQPDKEGQCAMWVISNPDQILPCYVIYLRRK